MASFQVHVEMSIDCYKKDMIRSRPVKQHTVPLSGSATYSTI